MKCTRQYLTYILIKTEIVFRSVVLEMKSTIGQTEAFVRLELNICVSYIEIPFCYIVYVIILKSNAQNILNIRCNSLSYEAGAHVSCYVYALTFLSSTFC